MTLETEIVSVMIAEKKGEGGGIKVKVTNLKNSTSVL